METFLFLFLFVTAWSVLNRPVNDFHTSSNVAAVVYSHPEFWLHCCSSFGSLEGSISDSAMADRLTMMGAFVSLQLVIKL